MKLATRHRGPLLMVGSAAAWAGGLVATKHAIEVADTSESSLLLLQLAASIVALAVGCAVTGASPRPAWRAGWVGLLEPGLAYQLALAGLALTSAASASILGSLEPAVVPLVAWLLLRERPTAALLAVVGGATVGAALVSLAPSTGERTLAGDLLIVGSVVAAALYVVVASRRVAEVAPLPTALAQQTWALGFVALVVVGAAVLGAGELPPLRFDTVAWAAGSGILGYAVPFWLYLTALTRMPVARAATYLTLIPVFGVVLSVVLLGESMTVVQGLGAAIVVASLALGTRLDRSDRDADPGDPGDPGDPLDREIRPVLVPAP
ncbi:MAG TPA: DMT family transporter [Iamia sp.]